MEHNIFASEELGKYSLWTCQKVTAALVYLLDKMYIRFGSKLLGIVGIPIWTNCTRLLLICFHFRYERDFMKSDTEENGLT